MPIRSGSFSSYVKLRLSFSPLVNPLAQTSSVAQQHPYAQSVGAQLGCSAIVRSVSPLSVQEICLPRYVLHRRWVGLLRLSAAPFEPPSNSNRLNASRLPIPRV